jgi:hypothetical protein
MSTLATVKLDNTEGPALNNQLVIVPLSGVSFPFASVQANGRNLDVLDADGVTSLAHSLRDWGQPVGLRLDSRIAIPASGNGHPYTFATCLVTGNLGTANDPHTILGCGGPLDDPNPVYGEWNCYDRLDNLVWTYRTPLQDYPMAADIGDLSGNGTDLVAALGSRKAQHSGWVVNPNGTLRWSFDIGENRQAPQ